MVGGTRAFITVYFPFAIGVRKTYESEAEMPLQCPAMTQSRRISSMRLPSLLALVALLGCLPRRAMVAGSSSVASQGSSQPPAAPAVAEVAKAAVADSSSATESAVGSARAAPVAAGEAANSESAAAPVVPQEPPLPESEGGWENRFAWGIYYSKLAVEALESSAGRWTFDSEGSQAAVPERMLRAEVLLRDSSAEASPAKKQQEKRAELALRLYYHAKWLAERNLAAAAEWRYREASRIAKENKRSVLASHALSRLGYFLMHWRRYDEAREILRVSEKINTKANPLAPYLLGVLERQVAGADVERLRAAEDRILAAQKQPSEDLETQRLQLHEEISFWRVAEESPWKCFETYNVAHGLICLCGHAAMAVLHGVVE